MYPNELIDSKPERTHYMTSFRRNYLNRVLSKLQELMDSHFEMHENNEWYDGLFLNEDCQETLGFVFVACQTFIVGVVADSTNINEPELTFKEKDKIKSQAMKNAPQFRKARTKVELINALANYYKHRDEGEVMGETKRILESYKLLEEEFLINEAFHMITEDNKIETLANFLFSWSNHMFNTIPENTGQKRSC